MSNTRLYTTAGLFGAVYAALLGTERGKEWIDEYTTLGVVLGVLGVLVALRGTQSRDVWRQTTGAFVAAGVPLVVRGILRRS